MVVNRGADLKQKFFTRTGEKSSSLAETCLAGLTKQAEGAKSARHSARPLNPFGGHDHDPPRRAPKPIGMHWARRCRMRRDRT